MIEIALFVLLFFAAGIGLAFIVFSIWLRWYNNQKIIDKVKKTRREIT